MTQSDIEVIEMLTVSEVAQLLNKHRLTILRWIQTGKLPASRVGDKGHWMIPKADLLRIIGCDANSGEERHAEET